MENERIQQVEGEFHDIALGVHLQGPLEQQGQNHLEGGENDEPQPTAMLVSSSTSPLDMQVDDENENGVALSGDVILEKINATTQPASSVAGADVADSSGAGAGRNKADNEFDDSKKEDDAAVGSLIDEGLDLDRNIRYRVASDPKSSEFDDSKKEDDAAVGSLIDEGLDLDRNIRYRVASDPKCSEFDDSKKEDDAAVGSLIDEGLDLDRNIRYRVASDPKCSDITRPVAIVKPVNRTSEQHYSVPRDTNYSGHCLSCLRIKAKVIIKPCHHHVLCHECVQQASHCPECGTKIQDTEDPSQNLR